ncbi:hypothetical protein ACFOWE_00840 [Planomonospora corallina]|uniref:Uncharacterized protein n=1 Tax=Planomonospora corallina TaxID=1806052 RepID=A0ABV8HY18_9ACTN
MPSARPGTTVSARPGPRGLPLRPAVRDGGAQSRSGAAPATGAIAGPSGASAGTFTGPSAADPPATSSGIPSAAPSAAPSGEVSGGLAPTGGGRPGDHPYGGVFEPPLRGSDICRKLPPDDRRTGCVRAWENFERVRNLP